MNGDKLGHPPAPRPENENERLLEVWQLGLLDSVPERKFDQLTRLVSLALDIPTVLISLVDANRAWFKSVQSCDVGEVQRDLAFCSHAILEDRVLIIPDTLADERFRNNALVTDPPHIRAYIGAVLRSASGAAIGTLCAMDYVPRDFSGPDVEKLLIAADILNSHVLPGGVPTRDYATTCLRAFVDPVSGLNFEESLAVRFQSRWESQREKSWVCLRLQLAEFDAVSDDFGRQVRERMVIAFADRLDSEALTLNGLTARLGRNDFCLLVPAGRVASTADVHDLQQRLQMPLLAGGDLQSMTAFWGSASFRSDKTSLAEALLLAEESLLADQACGPQSGSVLDIKAVGDRQSVTAAVDAYLEESLVAACFFQEADRRSRQPRTLLFRPVWPVEITVDGAFLDVYEVIRDNGQEESVICRLLSQVGALIGPDVSVPPGSLAFPVSATAVLRGKLLSAMTVIAGHHGIALDRIRIDLRAAHAELVVGGLAEQAARAVREAGMQLCLDNTSLLDLPTNLVARGTPDAISFNLQEVTPASDGDFSAYMVANRLIDVFLGLEDPPLLVGLGAVDESIVAMISNVDTFRSNEALPLGKETLAEAIRRLSSRL
ncbi:MAG: diguanylate cyclase domain-containing protein [Rhodospirillales bacterium]